ncbi:hypothetical protein JCM18909_3356 [Cutibacterium acnes JCM 18909]|nr:hypothetical protein JCM18909_3356 [Cutibacterium acnes JCM 18909]
MKADYTDQVVRPVLGEWVDESMATTRGPSVLLLFILQPFQKNNCYDEAVFVITFVFRKKSRPSVIYTARHHNRHKRILRRSMMSR